MKQQKFSHFRSLVPPIGKTGQAALMMRHPFAQLTLATCLMLCAAPGVAQPAPLAAHVQPAAPPSIVARYQKADDYLGANLNTLIGNRDLQARFVADSKGVIYRGGSAAARQIDYLDLVTGASRTIVTETVLADLLGKAAAKPVTAATLNIEKPEFDPGSGVLKFGAFDKRWALDANGALSEAATGDSDGETGLSPDGRFRIVARNFNLFAVDVKSGRETALTRDGTREQPYGRSIPQLPDILKQGTEDPVMPVSVRWSPDSRQIMTWRLDTRGVAKLSMTQENPPGSFYPRSFSYIYPLAGAEKLPMADRLIIDVERALKKRKAKIVPIAVPSEALLYPAEPDMGWSGDKGRLMWTERGYGQQVVYTIDPKTGAATVTAREAAKPIVTVTSSFIQPAPELGGELAVSERSGWAQLYLVTPDAPDGGAPLTRGDWEVLSIEHVDAQRRSILLTGVGRERDRNPYWRALYRVTMDGSAPVLLTPEPLEHEISVSPDGRFAIDAMSSPTIPTRTVVRDTNDGRIIRELGRADPTALIASGYTAPELFKGVAADGTTPIYGMIYRPARFDPARRYPVIDSVYTGPTTTQVPTSWDETVSANANSVAQLGAIVVMIDGRGTSRRGQAFRLPAYQNLGEVGIDDHITMIRQMAARYPYIDTTRVGVYGGSAGGYDAARFILRRPTFFKVAVSSSGNHDLRLDKAWWPEVSMGIADVATWERNSNMSVAANLQGKLLLIHGDIDDNVPVTESFRLANALIQAKRDVDLVILPNTTHRVAQPFFWRKLRDYFTRNLLDEAPPALLPLTPVPADASTSTPSSSIQ
ncbi:S9 family peptidase [Sphingomonas alpina]|uniref:DPP IV N-terminal domain-containing protein n=2 Tax=Sphingomonas alpina TaxID=653931 RepID=A0A7H0LJ84_9SPHN|nr:prolyl oligopeptidase family serine peptidase [Sphingomonas alpina]QNQ09737.1 DPP IV N-terminal domain-containing protein [Sphingomonas alpina]